MDNAFVVTGYTAAITALAGVVVYLYKQITTMYGQIDTVKSDHAKCREDFARSDERLKVLEKTVTAIHTEVKNTAAAMPTVVAKDTTAQT